MCKLSRRLPAVPLKRDKLPGQACLVQKLHKVCGESVVAVAASVVAVAAAAASLLSCSCRSFALMCPDFSLSVFRSSAKE